MLYSCFRKIELTVCALAGAAVLAGCQTAPPAKTPAPQASAVAAVTPPSGNSLILQAGDTLKITFPGAPNLDSLVPIRRDGKITLQMIGEYDAAGKTPATVEADLKKLYASQLVNNDVSVTVQSSAFVVYVMGAVTKPGKIVSERPLNVMQALIEAGIDPVKSNLKSVQILRTDGDGNTEKTVLNLQKFLSKSNEPMPSFTLKPYDIINVRERFNFLQ